MHIGIDIGGTKCAVIAGEDPLHIEKKTRFATTTVDETLAAIFKAVEEMGPADAIGISCGGPLNEKTGVIMSPPNLPGWDNLPLCDMLTERFGIPAYLRNDANACALAEWRYGAGQGVDNMVFLTCGTGMGAGLILDGKLYSGTNGNAGEVGHIRLAPDGPVGFGKAGSFEGFCSGTGMAKLGRSLIRERQARGEKTPYDTFDIEKLTVKELAEFARDGEEIARETFRISGEKMGAALSVLIDILNIDRIVIGSVFARCEDLLREPMERVIAAEALGLSTAVCQVVPVALGEQIGDMAAMAVALEGR